MNLGSPSARGLIRSWTSLYTTGLPKRLQTERLNEVESDLWDQQLDDSLHGVNSDGTSREMLVRLVTGMPADLAWRFEQQHRSRRSRNMLAVIQQNTWQRNGLWGLAFLLAGFYLVTGVLLASNPEGYDSLAERLIFGGAVFLFGALILGGFAVTPRRPLLGAVLIVIGAVGGTTVMFWMTPILAPFVLAVAGFGIYRARGFMRAARSETGPPTGTATA